MQAPVCTYIHTYVHTYIRTYIHTYICMYEGAYRYEGAYVTKRFSPSASTSRARPSDVATFDKDQQICFMLMPRS